LETKIGQFIWLPISMWEDHYGDPNDTKFGFPLPIKHYFIRVEIKGMCLNGRDKGGCYVYSDTYQNTYPIHKSIMMKFIGKADLVSGEENYDRENYEEWEVNWVEPSETVTSEGATAKSK
jgi:hypothetical protein